MDVDKASQGYHRLSTLSPMEYCWVASNFASALNQNPHFVPSASQNRAMYFSGCLSQFGTRTRYSSINFCCLILHDDHLLVFGIKPQVDSPDTIRTGLRELSEFSCYIPSFLCDRDLLTMNEAEFPGAPQSSITAILWRWACRITRDIPTLAALFKGVLYKTVPNLAPVFPHAASKHVTGVVGVIFEPGSRTFDPDRDAAWNLHSKFTRGMGMWLNERQVRTATWHHPRLKDLALAAFKVKKGQSVAGDGFQLGELK